MKKLSKKITKKLKPIKVKKFKKHELFAKLKKLSWWEKDFDKWLSV